MDVELVRRWAAAGYLPTFRRLLESAAWTDYLNPPEHTSGNLWPSIHSGVGPLRHDFNYAVMFCPDSYRTRMGAARDLNIEPFWKWFAQSGRRVVVVDAPLTIPDPECGGKQVWGWGVHTSPWHGSSVPRGLLSEIVTQFGPHPAPDCHNYSTRTESLLRFTSSLRTGIERRTSIFRSLLAARDWDLFYGVYTEAHCAGHLMWHLEDESHPQHTQEQFAIVGHALREIYASLDGALAELLACADPHTISVVFLPDGMGPNYHGAHLFSAFLERFNQRWGENAASGASRPSQNGPFDALWKASVGVMPAGFRARVKLLLPSGLRRWVTTQRRLNPGRLSRLPAFWLPQDGLSLVRVNLLGREKKGRIRPGEEYRRYIDALTTELLQAANAENGQPAVERIFRADQQVDPMTIGSGPDLIAWWCKSAPIRAIRTATLGTISDEFAEIPTGEHVMRGMLALCHPLIQGGRRTIPGASALDIPATLCELAGIQPGIALEGTSRCGDLAPSIGQG